ncbi:MAG: hypothetical protein ACYTGG_10630 [Planctomycetota bacterium]
MVSTHDGGRSRKSCGALLILSRATCGVARAECPWTGLENPAAPVDIGFGRSVELRAELLAAWT